MASVKQYTNKSGAVWKCFWYEGSKLRSETFYKEQDALDHKTLMEANAIKGKTYDPAPGKMKYKEWAKQYQRQWVEPKLTYKVGLNYTYSLETCLLPFFGDYQLNQISSEAVASWVEWASPKWSAWTIKQAFVVLRASLSYAVTLNKLKTNPISNCGKLLPRTPKRKTKVILPPSAVKSLSEAVKPRYEALVLLMGVHGLRPGEALALRVGDLHLTADVPYVSVTKSVVEAAGRMVENDETKTGEDRDVQLFANVVDALMRHMGNLESLEDDDLLFYQERGGGFLHESFIRTIIATAAKNIGYPGVTPYTLRHIACVNTLEATSDIEYVRQMLGHKDIKTTLAFYNHATDASKAAAKMKMEAIYAS